MFTGIVENMGTLLEVAPKPGGRRLRVQSGPIAERCPVGSSVCVHGVCLTVSDHGGDWLAFDVIRETLERSTLGDKKAGDTVNLERALTADARIDGHFVQGHVDGTARITRVRASAREHVVRLEPQDQLRPYLVPKGSVALDGVSLTIADLDGGQFTVALIPTTLQRTSLGRWKAGDRVNVETDLIVRTIVHHLSRFGAAGGLDLGALHEAGFA